MRARMSDFVKNEDYYAKGIQIILDTQVDPTVARQINSAGGGRTVLTESLKFIKRVLPP